MLLQGIVETLDAELDRLHRLRAIVAEISVPLATDLNPPVASAPAPKALQKPGTEVLGKAPEGPRQKGAAVSRARTDAKQQVREASALNGSIPVGPVVVNAAAVAKYHAAKQVAKSARKPAEPTGTLGSMIRALHLDRPNPES